MKNKKGFTLVELLAVIVIMSLIMMFVFPAIEGMIDNSNRRKYEAYEKSMTEYAKAYFEDSAINIIGLTLIKEKGLKGIDSECIGYVIKNSNYKAYIKCGDNYQTDDFNTSYAS